MRVKNLFIKDKRGSCMRSVESLDASPKGIYGNVPCLPLRQVLIVPNQTLTEFDLCPGDLRENILIDGLDVHKLESGTVIQIGCVKIRLTFHCEPCKTIKNKVSLKKILHKRGVLGVFLDSGLINIGDEIIVRDKSHDSIPYNIADRIQWYLDKQDSPVPVSKLVFDIGLSISYCRAIPNLIRKRDNMKSHLILYKKTRKERVVRQR